MFRNYRVYPVTNFIRLRIFLSKLQKYTIAWYYNAIRVRKMYSFRQTSRKPSLVLRITWILPNLSNNSLIELAKSLESRSIVQQIPLRAKNDQQISRTRPNLLFLRPLFIHRNPQGLPLFISESLSSDGTYTSDILWSMEKNGQDWSRATKEGRLVVYRWVIFENDIERGWGWGWA